MLQRNFLMSLGAGCVVSQLPAMAEAANAFRPVMSFEDAARPYLKEQYAKDGYVDRSGVVRNGGLGCSAYVSVVLHRMRDGPDWHICPVKLFILEKLPISDRQRKM